MLVALACKSPPIPISSVITNVLAAVCSQKDLYVQLQETITLNGKVLDLVAIVAYQGSGFSGHWVAYRRVDRHWYLCDDAIIRRLTQFEDVRTQLLPESVRPRNVPGYTPYMLQFTPHGVLDCHTTPITFYEEFRASLRSGGDASGRGGPLLASMSDDLSGSEAETPAYGGRYDGGAAAPAGAGSLVVLGDTQDSDGMPVEGALFRVPMGDSTAPNLGDVFARDLECLDEGTMLNDTVMSTLAR